MRCWPSAFLCTPTPVFGFLEFNVAHPLRYDVLFMSSFLALALGASSNTRDGGSRSGGGGSSSSSGSISIALHYQRRTTPGPVAIPIPINLTHPKRPPIKHRTTCIPPGPQPQPDPRSANTTHTPAK